MVDSQIIYDVLGEPVDFERALNAIKEYIK